MMPDLAKLRLGLQRTSLQDWPPYLAGVLFFPGCNLRCPWCHNPGLVRAPWDPGLLAWDAIQDILARRAGTISAVVASGGEALLHPALVPVLQYCKSLGYQIRLDTNGTQPGRLKALPSGLLDALAMDLKLDASGTVLGGQAETVALVRARALPCEFRLVWAPGWHHESSIPTIARLLGPGTSLSLRPFRPGSCLDPAWNSHQACPEETLSRLGGLFRNEGIVLIL